MGAVLYGARSASRFTRSSLQVLGTSGSFDGVRGRNVHVDCVKYEGRALGKPLRG